MAFWLAAGIPLPAAAQYVAITVGPGRPNGPQPADWEPAVRKLLEGDVRAEWVVYGPGRSARLRVIGTAWSARVSPENRARAWAALKESWGADLQLEQAFYGSLPPKTAAPTPMVASLPPALGGDQAKRLIGNRFDALLAGAADPFFDGSAGRRGLASAPPSVPGAPGARPGLPAGLASPAPEAPQDPAAKARPYEVEVAKAAAAAGVDAEVLRAVVAAKSGYDARRRSGDAYGLMGVSSWAGRSAGVSKADLLDPEKNLAVGARILGDMISMFRDCRRDDAACRSRPPSQLELHRALAAYQAGPKEVAESRGIPNDPYVKDFLAAFDRAYRAPQASAGRKVPPSPGSRDRVEPPQGTIGRELGERRREREIAKLPQARQLPQYLNATVAWRELLRKVSKDLNKKIDENLLLAMIQVESEGDPSAIGDNRRRKGRKRAPIPSCGLGQIKPSTAAGMDGKDEYTCEELKDPETNLRLMVLYFDYLKRRFGAYGAVSAYNKGEGAYLEDGPDNTSYLLKVARFYRVLTGKSPW